MSEIKMVLGSEHDGSKVFEAHPAADGLWHAWVKGVNGITYCTSWAGALGTALRKVQFENISKIDLNVGGKARTFVMADILSGLISQHIEDELSRTPETAA